MSKFHARSRKSAVFLHGQIDSSTFNLSIRDWTTVGSGEPSESGSFSTSSASLALHTSISNCSLKVSQDCDPDYEQNKKI